MYTFKISQPLPNPFGWNGLRNIAFCKLPRTARPMRCVTTTSHCDVWGSHSIGSAPFYSFFSARLPQAGSFLPLPLLSHLPFLLFDSLTVRTRGLSVAVRLLSTRSLLQRSFILFVFFSFHSSEQRLAFYFPTFMAHFLKVSGINLLLSAFLVIPSPQDDHTFAFFFIFSAYSENFKRNKKRTPAACKGRKIKKRC